MNTYSITEQVDLGTAALSRGDHEKARFYFLSAARALLAKAKQHHGQVRQQYVEQANKLWKYAQQHTFVSGQITQSLTRQPQNPISSDNSYAQDAPKNISLDDVAGLENVKKAFRAKFIYPLQDPENAKRYKQTGAGGLLLYGPPGTGKTFLVRALASELNAPVFIIKPSEIMTKWVGDTEQKLAAIFDEARQNPVALIFIDEIDALTPSRSDNDNSVIARLVPQLLAELDGFTRNENKLLFIGATNEPWDLDKAMMRPGRFDRLCYVGLPEQQAREQILRQELDGVALDKSLNISDIAKLTEGYTGADLFGLCLQATEIPWTECMETGIQRDVGLADFETVIAKTSPSVAPKDLEKYINYQKNH